MSAPAGELPTAVARPSDPAVTHQPLTVDCPHCGGVHHHGGAGRRQADCGRGEYVVATN